MTDLDTMDTLEVTLSDAERIEMMVQMLDNFLSSGMERSLIPVAEVTNLALDLRLALKPVGSG